MAFPYIFADNFETGSNANWDSESDTGGVMDFPHYSTLAGVPGLPAPYRGAYCLRVKLGNTNDAVLIEGDIDIADTVTRYSSFNLFISKDQAATATDIINIYEVQGTANAVENVVALRLSSSGATEIGVGSATVSAYVGISKGVWHHVELVSVIQTGGTGTATLWLDGASVATEIGITNTAVLRGVLGVQDCLATTSGTLLFDSFKFDDSQAYPSNQRFPNTPRITQSGHVFVGPGWIDGATILSANGTMDLYDTDTGNTNNAQSKLVELNTSGNFVSYDQPVYFERGCYVALGGTNPYGEVRLVTNPMRRGIFGPKYHWSDGAIREYGLKRVPRPQNV